MQAYCWSIFAVLFLLLITTCGPIPEEESSGEEQRPARTLEERQAQLAALPTREGEPVDQFTQTVLKEWISIRDKNPDEFTDLPEPITTEDMLAAAYEIALRRQNAQPGNWSPALREDVELAIGLFCRIARFFNWPKEDDFKTTMAEMTSRFIPGAYERLLLSLAVREELLTKPSTEFRSQEVNPNPADLLHRELLDLLHREREQQ